MKYKAPRMAAIFFMTSFNRDRVGHGTLGHPLDPQLNIDNKMVKNATVVPYFGMGIMGGTI